MAHGMSQGMPQSMPHGIRHGMPRTSRGEALNKDTISDDSIENEEKERRYICKECDKAFTTRIHTGVKPFACLLEGCSSRFSRQDNMMQHYRSHMLKLQRSDTSGQSFVLQFNLPPVMMGTSPTSTSRPNVVLNPSFQRMTPRTSLSDAPKKRRRRSKE
ncbi:uncharacterized protein SPPG_06711 [Spizellomyces punctatus DAOM BR117]|uniref:C2H2-type domain-containing protein n=1 Tax=Spizellomyces punctatus (strain DAOM BR117) TaxID=645134 RepID=A0A0L0HC22_SPIPD|nr:uncharacterized protein SPPG_06711 [Spizellomyces punctatus DAOM BR117]KNC98318.1 hypothetical protein SPPG_06711 [Spizellomyces punctatus DAOM BR117]|eukprot:XP_016606358.1 hypothetical protein SPPG_06711 [Spizellomyces punctatus DAOM BR117]